MDVARAPADPSGLMIQLKIASNRYVRCDRKPTAARQGAHTRYKLAHGEGLTIKSSVPAAKPRRHKNSSPRDQSMMIGVASRPPPATGHKFRAQTCRAASIQR
jgi:hypothetical protein